MYPNGEVKSPSIDLMGVDVVTRFTCGNVFEISYEIKFLLDLRSINSSSPRADLFVTNKLIMASSQLALPLILWLPYRGSLFVFFLNVYFSGLGLLLRFEKEVLLLIEELYHSRNGASITYELQWASKSCYHLFIQKLSSRGFSCGPRFQPFGEIVCCYNDISCLCGSCSRTNRTDEMNTPLLKGEARLLVRGI